MAPTASAVHPTSQDVHGSCGLGCLRLLLASSTRSNSPTLSRTVTVAGDGPQKSWDAVSVLKRGLDVKYTQMADSTTRGQYLTHRTVTAVVGDRAWGRARLWPDVLPDACRSVQVLGGQLVPGSLPSPDSPESHPSAHGCSTCAYTSLSFLLQGSLAERLGHLVTILISFDQTCLFLHY